MSEMNTHDAIEWEGSALVYRTRVLTGSENNLQTWEKLAAEVNRLREETKRLDRLFQSLTPGGSEFVNDPERCIKFAKDVQTSQHNIIKKWVKAEKKAVARIAELEAELAEVKKQPE